MKFRSLTEIAIYLVCEDKVPYSRYTDYTTYEQLQNQLNYELNMGIFRKHEGAVEL